MYVTYTSYWNLVGYPSVAFPVLKSDASIDGKPDIEPISDFEKQLWNGYDPIACDGECVGLQVINGRFEDEKALKLAGDITDALEKL